MWHGLAWSRLTAGGTYHAAIRCLSQDVPLCPWHQPLCVQRGGKGLGALPQTPLDPEKVAQLPIAAQLLVLFHAFLWVSSEEWPWVLGSLPPEGAPCQSEPRVATPHYIKWP